MSGDDTHGTKRRRTRSNPLSHARGKQQRPENIWFRKEGAGYSLFLEYYAGQPNGVVVSTSDTRGVGAGATVVGPTQSVSVGHSVLVGGGGQSRASKRRNKRKNVISASVRGDRYPNGQLSQQGLPISSPSYIPQKTRHFEAKNTSTLLQWYYGKVVSQKKQESTECFTRLLPFVEAMSRPLPLTFRLRLHASPTTLTALQTILQTDHPEVAPISFGNGHIYQASSLSKSSISFELKQFLHTRSQDGTLARQELGSMLPVLALATGGYLHHKSRVLDMCASPGSKTLQALEYISSSSGRILANDVLSSRLEALQKVVERSGLATEHTQRISYSCQDATQITTASPRHWKVVLCDVPCSGDGTCRKDKHVLPMWKPNHGNRLHTTQVKILTRALQLLKEGGVVCYSTCSLNPVENEAVVAAAIKKVKGQATLLNFPSLPEFVRRPGVSHWRVATYTDEDGQCWYDSHQEALDNDMADKPVPSLWPSPDNTNLHLERCTRLWPQDHDSGGFFLALIQKPASSVE